LKEELPELNDATDENIVDDVASGV